MLLHKPQWLLAAVLILGQTTLLVHQSDLDAHSGPADNCVVCHIASNMDGIPGDISLHVINSVATQAKLPVIPVVFYPAFTHLPRSRAPPVTHAIQS